MGEIKKANKSRSDKFRRTNQAKKSLASTKRYYNQGYGDAGASTKRRAIKGFDAFSGSPARDIDENNLTLRQRSRMLYMSAPLATSAIRTNRTNVIGVGLHPQSKIDAEALGMTDEQARQWQDKAEREFAIWASNKANCDATGMNNFYGMQQLALTSWLMSGDCFALIKRKKATQLNPYGLRLHLIEADRVATPSSAVPSPGVNYTTAVLENKHWCYDGVEVDADGAVVAYHVRNTYPQEYTGQITDFVRIPAYGTKTGLPNILHVMDSERPEQYRGVSILAQVIEQILQVKRYTDSELMAAVVESFFTAFIKVEGDTSDFPFDELTPEGEIDEPYDDTEYEMGPGQINVLKPGEDVTFGDPKRPTSGFSAFAQSLATQIGAALEIPAGLLLKQFTASYSASRAELLEAWKAFRMRRTWFVDDFCQPVWELWLSEAVALGRIDAPGFFTDPLRHAAYLNCEWIGTPEGQLDPVKEISAQILAIEHGLTTHEAAAMQLNSSSWDANIKRLEYENERLAQAQSSLATENSVSHPTVQTSSQTDDGGDNDT